MFSETHSSKMRTFFSSLFVTLHWVKHHNLCNRTGIHSNIGLHSDVSNLTILSCVNIDDLTDFPVSTGCIQILDYHKVVYLNILFLWELMTEIHPLSTTSTQFFRKGLMAFMAYKMMLAQGARHLEKGMIHHQVHLECSQLDIDS